MYWVVALVWGCGRMVVVWRGVWCGGGVRGVWVWRGVLQVRSGLMMAFTTALREEGLSFQRPPTRLVVRTAQAQAQAHAQPGVVQDSEAQEARAARGASGSGSAAGGHEGVYTQASGNR